MQVAQRRSKRAQSERRSLRPHNTTQTQGCSRRLRGVRTFRTPSTRGGHSRPTLQARAGASFRLKAAWTVWERRVRRCVQNFGSKAAARQRNLPCFINRTNAWPHGADRSHLRAEVRVRRPARVSAGSSGIPTKIFKLGQRSHTHARRR